MNHVLDSQYVENIQRLALGIEPIDAQRLHRVARPLSITVEAPPKASAKPAVVRHSSCLHALLYYTELVDTVAIRIQEDLRVFVPRRFSIPVHTAATVDGFPVGDRVRRPFLFPGAAYDVDACATGIRGQVLRGGKPMRWARVEAVLVSSGDVVARAHGDDRGEFLLLIGSDAVPPGDLPNPLTLRITVFGPAAVPVPVPPDLPLRDPLWDLPLETPPAPGAPDPVSTGEQLPVNYTASTTVDIAFTLGVLRTGLAAFTIP
jgi:hypothetical protein